MEQISLCQVGALVPKHQKIVSEHTTAVSVPVNRRVFPTTSVFTSSEGVKNCYFKKLKFLCYHSYELQKRFVMNDPYLDKRFL